MHNHLKGQTSPYLLQHADNPVDWYPWCEEAFERAKAEDKPVFLSIGYSTCHWCHVMAHESFEDEEIAEILNRSFISIKVDKEERPDIDSIYMAVCQAFTGSGGWPMSIFLTPEQKPFFAGTYFPKNGSYGRIGFRELLLQVQRRWQTSRQRFVGSAEDIISILQKDALRSARQDIGSRKKNDIENLENGSFTLIEQAVKIFKTTFDRTFGGFGDAPKFPTPHNLLFLMKYYEKRQDKMALYMVEKTLTRMYRGGIFDHIGGGFCRYSTDPYFLVPHFEKMLYDNALLMMAYCKVYELTKKGQYLDIAKCVAGFILREMTSEEGGFYSAKDADSEGVEGKYYVFDPKELMEVLGEKEGAAFNRFFDITEAGNFEGKSIPNLLNNEAVAENGVTSEEKERIDNDRAVVYEYRSRRYALHLDDKILTSWNGLMITALCRLYRVSGKRAYLEAAVGAWEFIRDHLCEEAALYVSWRGGMHSKKGFLDDYAFVILALLELYGATLKVSYLERALRFCKKVISEYYDKEHGGFFLYGEENEQLIFRPKECYDGAVFSGNSAMAYNLVRLVLLTEDHSLAQVLREQVAFMSDEADHYPAGYTMFLMALLDVLEPPDKLTIVAKDEEELAYLPCAVPLDTVLTVSKKSETAYPLKNDRTTYYMCKGHTCLPPVNELGEAVAGVAKRNESKENS